MRRDIASRSHDFDTVSASDEGLGHLQYEDPCAFVGEARKGARDKADLHFVLTKRGWTRPESTRRAKERTSTLGTPNTAVRREMPDCSIP